MTQMNKPITVIKLTDRSLCFVYSREINGILSKLGFSFVDVKKYGGGWVAPNYGLVVRVLESLRDKNIPYEINDNAIAALEHNDQINKTILEVKLVSSHEDIPIQKTVAWEHQKKAYHFVRTLWAAERGALLYLAMGTGKSLVAIDLLMNTPRIRWAFIFCPKSVVNTWRNQFRYHSNIIPLTPKTGNGSSWNNHAQSITQIKQNGNSYVVVTNYESVLNDAFFAVVKQADCVICDEVHRIRSHNGKTAERFGELSLVRYRLGLSGTPMTQGVQDVWSQFRFLQPGIFDSSYYRFLDHFVKLDRYRKPIGVTNTKDFNEQFYQITLKVDRDVLDLPPIQHINIDIEMDSKTRELYSNVKNGLVVSLQNDEELSIASVVTEIIRLQQITSGFLPGKGHEFIDRIHTLKEDALCNIFSDLPRDEPIVVFGKYKEDIRGITAAAKAAGREVSRLTGEVNQLEQWQAGQTTVLAAQISTGKEGIDLTRACYVVYYSVGYSLIDYIQSHDRAHRPGQTRPVTFYHLVCVDTIDVIIYHALQHKLDVVQTVIGGLTGKIIIEGVMPMIERANEIVAVDQSVQIDIHKYLTKVIEIEAFSILNTTSGAWTARRRQWNKAGISAGEVFSTSQNAKGSISALTIEKGMSTTADQKTGLSGGFDPVLCEIMYRWFCPEGGRILDPFSGSSTAGMVATLLEYDFIGCDPREEQILRNREKPKYYQMKKKPMWYVGSSTEIDSLVSDPIDFIFTSPPYAGVEVYSDLAEDLSTMPYPQFIENYTVILRKVVNLLRADRYAGFVLGEARNNKGYYIGFVPDTVKILQSLGLEFYNEFILVAPVAGVAMTNKFEIKKKNGKHHQNVLIFYKPKYPKHGY